MTNKQLNIGSHEHGAQQNLLNESSIEERNCNTDILQEIGDGLWSFVKTDTSSNALTPQTGYGFEDLVKPESDFGVSGITPSIGYQRTVQSNQPFPWASTKIEAQDCNPKYVRVENDSLNVGVLSTKEAGLAKSEPLGNPDKDAAFMKAIEKASKSRFLTGPSKEECARRFMEEALSVKTPSGNNVAILYEHEEVRAMIPHMGLDENGLETAILYAKDFADGQLPPNMTIEPGTIKLVRNADGKLEEVVHFDNPRLNLSVEEQRALLFGEKLAAECKCEGFSLSSVEDVCKLIPSQSGVCFHALASQQEKEEPKGQPVKQVPDMAEDAFASGSGFTEIFERAGKGLFTRTKKGEFQLSNFTVRVVELRIIRSVNPKEADSAVYVLKITSTARSAEIEVKPNEMDNVVRLVQNRLPECMVSHEFNKVNSMVANYVRGQLLEANTKTIIIRRTGFQPVGEHLVYVHDGAVSPSSDMLFQTGKTILNNPHLNDTQALVGALGFLDMCPRDELILTLWLYAHLGPLFQIFEAAGFTPRFLIILAGQSGSLKTSMSMALFRLYADQTLTPEASFKDTPTSLEIRMGELNGRVLVIDDFRPPVSDRYSKGPVELMESIVRFVGDNIHKSRSNSKLGKAQEFTPSGCVLITAEDVSGSFSSLLRCLVLSIEREDIDGNLLRLYQDNPYLISSHLSRFLAWVGQLGEQVIRMIQDNFDTERSYFRTVVHELRLVDTAVTLMLVAQIICRYACDCSAMGVEEAQQFASRCRNAITEAVVASEARSCEADPVALYINALISLMDSGEVSIASSQASYTGGIHDGFFKNGKIWMKSPEVYGKIRRFYQRVDQVFPLTESQTCQHLANSDLIEVTFEKNGDRVKKLYTKKTSLPGRPRMLVLDMDQLEHYRENEMN